MKKEPIMDRIKNHFHNKYGSKIIKAEAIYLGGSEYRELLVGTQAISFLPDGTEEVYGLKLFRVNAINHFRVV